MKYGTEKDYKTRSYKVNDLVKCRVCPQLSSCAVPRLALLEGGDLLDLRQRIAQTHIYSTTKGGEV